MAGLLALGGCSTPRASVVVTPSPTSQAVSVSLALARQGTVEKRTLMLLATVTNHQTADITVCTTEHFPPVRIDVSSIYGTKLWNNEILSNADDFRRDVTTLAPGASQTWTQTLDVSHTGGFLTGVTFVAVASAYWHIGPLDCSGELTGPHGTATVRAEITLE